MPEVTILSDNSVARHRPVGLLAEWGFASAVDGVLFDTGLTGIARRNARKMGLDTDFDTIVLSHGHQDHTGGLMDFLEADTDPTIYAHPDVWRPRHKDGVYIGFPYPKERIESAGELIEHRGPVEVAEDVFALGEIPREHDDNPSGLTRADDDIVEDHVRDDQSLAIRTDEGVGLLLGCCHSGLRNTVEYAERTFDEDVRSVIGGMHLVDKDPGELDETIEWLSAKGTIDRIAPLHCTGTAAERGLRSAFEPQYLPAGVGSSIEL